MVDSKENYKFDLRVKGLRQDMMQSSTIQSATISIITQEFMLSISQITLNK